MFHNGALLITHRYNRVALCRSRCETSNKESEEEKSSSRAAMSSNFWSAQGLANLTIGLNIASFLWFRNSSYDNAFDVAQNNSVQAMVVSMFTHMNTEHLLGNMLSLFFTSLSVFIDPPPQWNSPWAFLWIYIPSGLTGFVGNSIMVNRLQRNFEKRQEEVGLSWNRVVGIWNGDEYRTAMERYSLWREVAAKRIGASGAVYGLVGARIYTAIFSPYHPPLNSDDLRALLGLLVEEAPRANWSSLDTVVSTSFVDHTAHLFGFITGMATAWMWDTWSSYCRKQRNTKYDARRYRGSSRQ